MFARAILVWMLIAMAEVGHGILRIRLLNRRVGDHRARQISVGTGSVIILILSGLTIPWIGPTSSADALAIGGLWVVLMLLFEFSLGRLVFRISWDRILADFDLRRGGLLGFGVLVIGAAPSLAARFHDLY